MTGLTYPYARHDRLLAGYDDLDLEFSPAPNPPSGTAGGAGRFKYWVDNTDVNNGILRQCVVARATAGAYVPGEWITLGVIDASNHKFHFNTDNVDFTGGSGSLTVHDLTVTGTSNLNILNVAGPANLNSLAVANYTALHNTGVTGDLTVTGEVSAAGALVGASLLVGGTITGADLIVNDNAHILGTLGIDGSLVVTGAITGASLSVSGAVTAGSISTDTITSSNLGLSGDLTVGGKLIVNGPNSVINQGLVIHPISGGTEALQLTADLGVTGQIIATGQITGGPITSSSAVTGSSISSSGPITGTTITGVDLHASGGINGATLNISGTAGIDGDLTVSGNLGVVGAATVGGPITAGGYIKSSATVIAQDWFAIDHAGTDRNILFYGTDSFGTISVALCGPTYNFTSHSGSQIDLYDTFNLYNSASHEFRTETSTPTVMAIFMAGSTSNQTGSWSIICDDTVKENVVPYTAGLADILQLDPVSFSYFIPSSRNAERWSPFADPFDTVTPTTHFGLLASNVREVLPEMAALLDFGGSGPDGLPSKLWTISPTHMVWVLTNAVKELSAQDTDLDSRLTVVEGHTPPVITITGDITGSGTPTIAATLPVVNSNPGTFQGLIVNAKGQVTGASNMSYAPLASPALTGSPTAPTPVHNDISTKLATTAFVRMGTTTNDSPAAGEIGEYIMVQTLSTAAIAMVNNVDLSIAVLALTAGDWEVWGSGGFTISGNSNTLLKAWINQTGAAVAPSIDQPGGYSVMPIGNGVTQMILPITPARVSLAAAGNVRLGATGIFTGTISAWGKVMARRIR